MPENASSPALEAFPPCPQVIWWFKVYCAVLCLIYLALAGGSSIFFLADPADLEMPQSTAYLVGAVLLVAGLSFFAAYLLPFVIRPRPWLWTYDLVLICGGMTSAFFLPVCIPLLIFWIKPEVKEFFGKR